MKSLIKILCTGLLIALLLPLPLTAQDKKAPPSPQTTSIRVAGELQQKLRPLFKDELKVEADGWMKVLRTVVEKESQTQIQLQDPKVTNKEPLQKTLIDLGAEKGKIEELFKSVLKAYGAKGGDVTDYQKYLDSVSGVSFDTSNASGFLITVKDWLLSDKGGIAWGINLLLFIVVLFAFSIVGRVAAGITARALKKFGRTSDLLRDFFTNTVRKLIFFVGLVVALGMLGVDIGPLLAAIGAVGFIVGFALQGTLSNFASGIMILLYRPYDLGDVVEVAGSVGGVSAMSLVSTTIKTPDNQVLVIPNNSIWGGTIKNITGSDTRRVDMVFGIGYDDNPDKAAKVLEEIVTSHSLVLKDPAPVVKMHELADSSVNFVVRPWCKTSDYWTVYWDITKEVKKRFDAEGISIPYPQMDVHLDKSEGA
ncbi:MAG TPA: mechanosensitive ion channel family protein [Planctomycetes bacterium]|nr:mechanosensitive ion channel family protein [Planctomycetota bacterium]